MELFELGINGYELRPSMVPQFNVQVHIDKRKEFEEKLKDDNFARNPRARLNFFYERSPYYDRRIGLYPVGRIVTKLDGKFLK